jgi:hypothetical protein
MDEGCLHVNVSLFFTHFVTLESDDECEGREVMKNEVKEGVQMRR